jgi:hypothetical protein
MQNSQPSCQSDSRAAQMRQQLIKFSPSTTLHNKSPQQEHHFGSNLVKCAYQGTEHAGKAPQASPITRRDEDSRHFQYFHREVCAPRRNASQLALRVVSTVKHKAVVVTAHDKGGGVAVQ